MKILVASEGVRSALQAVEHAAGRVGRLNPGEHGITLPSVHDDTAPAHARPCVGREAVADVLHQASKTQALPARRRLDKPGVRHDSVLRAGRVSQAILGCAKKGRFELTVMRSRDGAAIADLPPGSVAQRVRATAGTCAPSVT